MQSLVGSGIACCKAYFLQKICDKCIIAFLKRTVYNTRTEKFSVSFLTVGTLFANTINLIYFKIRIHKRILNQLAYHSPITNVGKN